MSCLYGKIWDTNTQNHKNGAAQHTPTWLISSKTLCVPVQTDCVLNSLQYFMVWWRQQHTTDGKFIAIFYAPILFVASTQGTIIAVRCDAFSAITRLPREVNWNQSMQCTTMQNRVVPFLRKVPKNSESEQINMETLERKLKNGHCTLHMVAPIPFGPNW